MLGMHGSAYANLAMQEADLIIALGARFDDRVTLSVAKFAPQAKLAATEGRGGIVHFEVLPKNINKVVQATEAVEGDVATNVQHLLPLIKRKSERPEWFAQITDWKKRFPFDYPKAAPDGLIKPQTVMETLSDLTAHIKDRTIITTGVGQHQMWCAQHYRWRHPRTMITSGGLGTMGFGLPAAIGAKVAAPESLVVDIDGDASFQMTLTELSTAAQFNIGVKIIVLNNEEQGMVTQWQALFYEDRYAHTHQTNPDFVKLAEAMGVQADRCIKPGDVKDKIDWLINTEGPALLEIVTDKKVGLFPMVPAGSGLHEFLVYDAGKLFYFGSKTHADDHQRKKNPHTRAGRKRQRLADHDSASSSSDEKGRHISGTACLRNSKISPSLRCTTFKLLANGWLRIAEKVLAFTMIPRIATNDKDL